MKVGRGVNSMEADVPSPGQLSALWEKKDQFCSRRKGVERGRECGHR